MTTAYDHLIDIPPPEITTVPRPTRTTTTVLAAVLFASGCASTPTYHVPPSPPLVTTTAEPIPGVPTVHNPLDLSVVLAEPCASLTVDQVAEYLGENTDMEPNTEESSGPSCSWYSGLRSNAQISITYPRLTDEGLTVIYRNRGKAAYFVEMPPVNGYPAISYDTDDSRGEGECLITVGTSNAEYVNIDVVLGTESAAALDPCEAAHDVATAVIANIQARQS